MKYLALSIFFLIGLIGKSQTSAADCVGSIPICGSSNYQLKPMGTGGDDFTSPNNYFPGCFVNENNTIWVRFQIETGGIFTFDIIPDNEEADYDFAIYGPTDDCENLGNSIRCSTTNPQAAGVSSFTGLSVDEDDINEGPGADGNGYVKHIEANDGDVYYMIIDLAIGEGDFSIEMTGDVTFPEQPIAYPVENIELCEKDDNADGLAFIELEQFIPTIINDQQNVEVSFHNNLNDVYLGENPLPTPYETTANPEIIYYRITKTESGCFDVGEFTVRTEAPFEISLPQDIFLCENTQDQFTLSVESGFAYYQWSTGEEGNDTNEISIDTGGEYFVIVTDALGCKVKASTIVTSSSPPESIEITIEDFNNSNNTATVIAKGPDTYEYSLDGINFSENNIFSGLGNGIYQVYIRDTQGCGIITREFIILDYPKFFTPNGDGYHDTWNIIGIGEFPQTKIYIYDRFGKLMKDIIPGNPGWDGNNYSGNPMPSSDYWFTISLDDGREYKGHFTLKR